MGSALVWLRRDLRLHDHPALHAACASGLRVVPVYIHDPDPSAAWATGAASHWWLHYSLQALDAALRQRGSRLIIRSGPAPQVLDQLIKQSGATAVYWSRQYEPAHIERDRRIKADLRERGLGVHSFAGNVLSEPWQIRTASGEAYKVFTPYWRNLGQRLQPASEPGASARLPDPGVDSLPLEQLQLLPSIGWDSEFSDHWQPGEAGAQQALELFMDDAARHYVAGRDRPDRHGTSRLSPHLHFGEISPNRIVQQLLHAGPMPVHQALEAHQPFIRELGWRDFACQLLYNFPHTPTQPLYDKWQAFPWRVDPVALGAWQRGRTGIPIVDAGLRQLWRHGWMHNRVRMLVASFLVKNLRLHWLEGARWFFDTLLDADLASNTLGWQWSAGCGADASPYFRIFNPVTQALKFDPAGDYVRSFVPELAHLPGASIHQPWLTGGGIHGYPDPVVDLKSSRADALAAFGEFRAGAG